MQSSPISPPQRVNPEPNVEHHHPRRSDRNDRRPSLLRHSHYHSHSNQNGHSVNSKEKSNGISSNGCSGVRSIKVTGNKELDTISDKQNQNTWSITNERSYYDSPEIPVVPLFTHTNSVDFHKNNFCSYDPVRVSNHDSIMNHTNGIYHNGNTIPTSKEPSKSSRKNDLCDEDLLNMGRIQELRDRMGGERVRINEKALWKCLGAEFLGTALLMFLGIGCVLKIQEEPVKGLSFLGVALCWGFTVATLVQALGGVSADFNPAITLACLLTGKTQIVKAIMYILIQCLGALAGTSLLKAVTPDSIEGAWGQTQLAAGITPIQGCAIEAISTFVLTFTAFSATDENRKDVKGSVPLAIGICICAIVMCSGPLTGASLNPARTLAPCIIAGNFDNHWVYWVGPIAGAIIAGLLYTNLFRHLTPDETEALEAESQLKRQEREAKDNGASPPV